jgi:hypothetical protein
MHVGQAETHKLHTFKYTLASGPGFAYPIQSDFIRTLNTTAGIYGQVRVRLSFKDWLKIRIIVP